MEHLNKILDTLEMPLSKVEAELSFGNGILGKVLKGQRTLSTENQEKLLVFYKEKTGKSFTEIGEPKKEVIVEGDKIKKQPSVLAKMVVTETMNKLNKDYGAGTVMFFGDKPNQEYEVISTGSLTLDNALGIGGLPRGRITEIFGWESSGKTTIALNVIANAQKKGLKCLLVDAENAFDPEYADALGVGVDNLLYCQPSCGDEALEVADRQMSAGDADVVVIDSVAALVPKAELEGQHGDSKMGLHARLMSQACRKMVGTIGKKNCICIFINQFRHKIGVQFGSPEVTTGGNALQFYASIRLEVRRSTTTENSVMNGDIKEGNKTTVKVIKNKCAPPFRKAEFNIIYGKGVFRVGEVADLAIRYGIIEKAGSWYSYGQTKLGQGVTSVYQILEDNIELANEIEAKIKEKEKK